MTDKVFADTNIAGYLLSNDSVKHGIAKTLIVAHPVISTQVVNEFINVCLKKAHLNLTQTHLLAESLMTVCRVVAVDSHTVSQAMQLSQRYQLSHWDSLIIAAALQADCTVLYSEDLQSGMVIDQRLTLINPFSS